MDNIKLNGHWEDVETPYIKENGHWVASDDQYIKVGGHWSDTKDLSSTKLDYDMTIASEPDSSRYLVNKVEPTTHKAPLHSGHSVALTGDGVIDVPINATLGSELISNGTFDTDLSGWAGKGGATGSSVNGRLELIGATNGFPRYAQEITVVVGKTYELSATYGVKSGIHPAGVGLNIGIALPTNSSTTLVTNSVSFIATGTTVDVECMVNSKPSDGTYIFDNVSIKEITAVQGSVTTFDYADNKFKQNKALPLSTTYQLKDGTYGITCKLHEHHFSDADISTLNASPEKLVAWYFGTATLPSGIVKGADDKVYYPVENYMVELSYAETEEKIDLMAHSKVSAPNTVATKNIDQTVTIHSEIDWEHNILQIQAITNANNLIDIYRQEIDIRMISGTLYLENIGAKNDIQHLNLVISKDITVNHIGKLRNWGPKSCVFMDLRCNIYHTFDAVFTIKQFKITSEVLPITGTHTTATGSQYGVQGLLVKENTAGVPTGLAKANTIEGATDGRYVQLPLVDNTKQKHLVTKCLTEIKGDITQVVDTPCTP